MNRRIDQLLAAGLLDVPKDFAQTIMARIDALPLPAMPERRSAKRWQEWSQWLALVGGVILGAAQLGGFIFGIWAASTVG